MPVLTGTALHRSCLGRASTGPGWTGPRPWPVGGPPGRGRVRADGGPGGITPRGAGAVGRAAGGGTARRGAGSGEGANGVGVVIFSARRPATG